MRKKFQKSNKRRFDKERLQINSNIEESDSEGIASGSCFDEDEIDIESFIDGSSDADYFNQE